LYTEQRAKIPDKGSKYRSVKYRTPGNTIFDMGPLGFTPGTNVYDSV